jgi:hypothetical protein
MDTNYCSSGRRLTAESLLFVLHSTFRFQFLATRVSIVSARPVSNGRATGGSHVTHFAKCDQLVNAVIWVV